MSKQIVIQAGGKGERLRPHTYVLPKPIMPLGDSTLLETNIRWLCKNNITKQKITLGYLGHLIEAIVGNGSQFGANIDYYNENTPLGTAGSLVNFADDLEDNFIMMNGDLVVDIDIDCFEKYHIANDYDVTVGAYTNLTKIEYGVLEVNDDGHLNNFHEKPELKNLVSMGIYFIKKEVIDLIPKGSPFGMDDLINKVINDGGKVGVFQHDGVWLDIGRLQHLENIQEEYSKIEAILLGI